MVQTKASVWSKIIRVGWWETKKMLMTLAIFGGWRYFDILFIKVVWQCKENILICVCASGSVTEPVSESSSLLSTSSINNRSPKCPLYSQVNFLSTAVWQRGLPREKGMSQEAHAAFQYTERSCRRANIWLTIHQKMYPPYLRPAYRCEPLFKVLFITQNSYFWVRLIFVYSIYYTYDI